MRNWHSSGVNDRRSLVWSPLGHWSGCVFYATWGKECAGSPIVSVCLRVSLSGHIPSVCVKERPIKGEWATVSHTLCRDSGGLNILEVIWSRVIWSRLIWTQKPRHAEKLCLHIYELTLTVYERKHVIPCWDSQSTRCTLKYRCTVPEEMPGK